MFVVYYIACFLGFVMPKSKYISLITYIILFVLFGFCFNHADYGIIDNRYSNLESTLDFTEPLFVLFVRLCNLLKLSLQQFLQAVAFLFITTLFYVVWKSKLRNRVISLYMLSPLFFYDVVQVRNTLALVLVYIAIFILMKVQGRKGVYIAISMILLASLIHFSAIVFGIYVAAYKLDLKKTIRYTFAFIIIVFAFSQTAVSSLLQYAVLGDKIDNVTKMAQEAYTAKTMLNNILMLLVTVVVYFYLYYINRHVKDEYADMVLKFNIASLCIIPLIYISVDFHRIFMAMQIFNFIVYAKWITLYDRKSISLFVVVSFLVVFMYRSLLSSNNVTTVYYAVMENNLLLK